MLFALVPSPLSMFIHYSSLPLKSKEPKPQADANSIPF